MRLGLLLPVRGEEATCVAPDALRSAATSPRAAADTVRDPEPGAAERHLVRGAVLTIALLALPVSAVAWALAGPSGALSALIGLGLVLVLFGASAAALVHVAVRAKGAGIGVLVGGAALRLPLYMVVLLALSGVPWVHGRSLAAATAVGVAVTLASELRLLSSLPQLFWIDVASAPSARLAHDPRS